MEKPFPLILIKKTVRRQRGAYALRLTVFILLGAVLRIVGYGAQSMAARNPSLLFLLYAIPILGAALALLELEGTWLQRLFSRPQPAEPLAAQ